mmetsp:Transcript_19736/g.61306  ORF Transcript_19736/g.61306 Transcript_19736/m.61306 type:complete len:233 (+) Transcript_19736:568-1266(+)
MRACSMVQFLAVKDARRAVAPTAIARSCSSAACRIGRRASVITSPHDSPRMYRWTVAGCGTGQVALFDAFTRHAAYALTRLGARRAVWLYTWQRSWRQSACIAAGAPTAAKIMCWYNRPEKASHPGLWDVSTAACWKQDTASRVHDSTAAHVVGVVKESLGFAASMQVAVPTSKPAPRHVHRLRWHPAASAHSGWPRMTTDARGAVAFHAEAHMALLACSGVVEGGVSPRCA